MYFKKFLAFISLSMLILAVAGCTIGESPAEKIYGHLEKTVSLESDFAKVQEPLTEAEQKEQELFDQMLGLSMKEIEQIQTLADEATESADAREELIKEEKQSVDSAYEEFKAIKSIVEDIDEEALKSSADELVQTMDQRYESYQELNKTYMEALNMDRELYGMMKKEDLAIEDLKSYTEELNQKYEEVLGLQDTFNKLTDQYNEKKKAFYKEAGINTTNKKDAS